MPHFEIIKCHGSGNDFIMVDAIAESPARSIDREAFARAACDRKTGIGGDGILFVERDGDGICVMDMLNPDGTHAEMCGNGIRCVARLAYERGYIVGDILRSGGRDYRVARGENMADGLKGVVNISLYEKKEETTSIPSSTHSPRIQRLRGIAKGISQQLIEEDERLAYLLNK